MAEKSFGLKQINMIGVGTPAIESSDDLIINTNGSERIRILGGGDVGIGTTNPESKLVIAGNSATAQIEIKRTNSNATGTVGALNFTALDGHSVANISAIADGDNEGADIVFRTTSAAGENSPFGGSTVERLRIHSTGYAEFSSGAVTRVLLSNDVATTSGTSITFPSSGSIPSWATKITLLFDRVSTSGASELLVQLGTSGGAITSGYDSSSANLAGTAAETSTAGFILYVNTASSQLTGKMEIQRLGTSSGWVSSHTMKHSDNTRDGAGVLTTYSGTIDRVVVTTEGGSNTFDGGAITVYYEA